jgi:hypothetical protein
MVRRWLRRREPGWKRSMVINAIGATATGIVLVIVTITKFSHGAWIVLAAMPVIILFFVGVHGHYERISRRLREERVTPDPDASTAFVLLVRDLGPATAKAVGYLRALRPDRVVPVFVGPADDQPDAARWNSFAPRMGALQRLPNAGAGVVGGLRRFVRSVRTTDDDFVTVVVPEALSSRSLVQHLVMGSAFWLKARLFFAADVVVADVPLLPDERTLDTRMEHPAAPTRHVVLIPVSGVHAATARAVSYALSLDAAEVQALFLSTEPGDEVELAGEWMDQRMGVPLSIVDAPFRDFSGPMLEEVRRFTCRPGTVVTVVLPELVVAHWWEHLLHNQSSLFFKRLLLFEPGVVVTSVPLHLSRASIGSMVGETS